MRRNFTAHHVYVTKYFILLNQAQPITVDVRVKSADSEVRYVLALPLEQTSFLMLLLFLLTALLFIMSVGA